MSVHYGKIVKKKEFDFYIPEFVDKAIDMLIEGINNNDLMADCYAAELDSNINHYLDIDFDEDQVQELKDYYIRGGMYIDAEDNPVKQW